MHTFLKSFKNQNHWIANKCYLVRQIAQILPKTAQFLLLAPTILANNRYHQKLSIVYPWFRVGSSKRPSLSYTRNLCEGDYNISGNIFKVDGGITFGEKTPIIKCKDEFPSPNKYYPVTLTSKASIPFTRSKRLAYKNEASEFPSPGDYNVEKSLEKSIKIPNGPRSNLVDFKANNPGPGTYETLD